MFKFTVPGNPKAQGRPRFFRRGNFVGAYDPKDSASFKQKVAFFAKEAGVGLIDHPACLVVHFYLKRPLKYMRKKDEEGRIACASRPDFDNLTKAIMDGLTGVAWKDDSIIYHADIYKWYHEKAGAQRTEIQVW